MADHAIAAIAAVITLWTGIWVLRKLPRARRAREAYRRHRYKMLRDCFFCVKCNHNVRGCTDRCSECGWPLDQDPD